MILATVWDRIRAAALCAGAVASLCAAGGCSGQSGRCAVSGRVTFDRTPVEEGVIVFAPAEGSQGPSAGGEIRGGSYVIAESGGPLAGGRYRVEITGYRKTGRRLPEVPGGPPAYDEKRNFIPPAFNLDSTLTAEIAPGERAATLDFDLVPPPQ